MNKNYLLAIFIILFIASCKKDNNPSNPNIPPPVSQTEFPDSVIEIQYLLNPPGVLFLKSIYSFPNGITDNKIEYYRLDSSFSAGNYTFSARNHTLYAFDPINKHIMQSSSRMVELFGKDSLSNNLGGNWDNSFDFSSGQQYPEHINITNYANYLQNGPTINNFSHNIFYPNIAFTPDNGNTMLLYQVILNDSGAIHLIDFGDGNNWYIFQNKLPGYHAGANDEYRYYIDSANYCNKFLYQNGYIKVALGEPDVFQPVAELRRIYRYDDNAADLSKLLGSIILTKDIFWNRIAANNSAITYRREPFYYFQKTCASYTDSLFTVDNNNIRNFYSSSTYHNEILRDQKGRIVSLKCKNGSGVLFDEFDFLYP